MKHTIIFYCKGLPKMEPEIESYWQLGEDLQKYLDSLNFGDIKAIRGTTGKLEQFITVRNITVLEGQPINAEIEKILKKWKISDKVTIFRKIMPVTATQAELDTECFLMTTRL